MSKVNQKELHITAGFSIALFTSNGLEACGSEDSSLLSRLMTTDGSIHWRIIHFN